MKTVAAAMSVCELVDEGILRVPPPGPVGLANAAASEFARGHGRVWRVHVLPVRNAPNVIKQTRGHCLSAPPHTHTPLPPHAMLSQ